MRLNNFVAVLLSLILVACNDSSNEQPSHAQTAGLTVAQQAPGATAFIADVTLRLNDFANLASLTYTVAPKPGTFSKPVTVTYTRDWLNRNGAWRAADKRLSFAVFGLYANHRNTVTVTATFRDASTHVERLMLSAPAYTGPGEIYNAPVIRTARSTSSTPGFDYMMLQNRLTTPAVVDTDGNLRWIGTGVPDSTSTVFVQDAFLIGSATTPELFQLQLSGTYRSVPLGSTRYTKFHHDFSRGKIGLLAELDGIDGSVPKIEAILAEIGPTGEVIKEWDMALIFRAAMQAGGDDPSNFVRDGVDWFHMNSAIYVAADDSLLVSSRENFVVKLDYATGRIKWLLGDTTKHWYVDYPSLRALALDLKSGKPPVGQHSLSIASNGELLLFNNGASSLQAPPGTSAGVDREYSTPSRYAIDETAGTAVETWTYTPTPAVLSSYCSSVFESAPGRYLVTYSMAENRTRARLLAIDEAGNVSFDIDYPTTLCDTAFIGRPIDFANLTLK